MRIEDVGVEQIGRVGGQRVRHPGNVPHAVLAVRVVAADAAAAAEIRAQRPGHGDREGDAGKTHKRELARPRDGAGRLLHVEFNAL